MGPQQGLPPADWRLFVHPLGAGKAIAVGCSAKGINTRGVVEGRSYRTWFARIDLDHIREPEIKVFYEAIRAVGSELTGYSPAPDARPGPPVDELRALARNTNIGFEPTRMSVCRSYRNPSDVKLIVERSFGAGVSVQSKLQENKYCDSYALLGCYPLLIDPKNLKVEVLDNVRSHRWYSFRLNGTTYIDERDLITDGYMVVSWYREEPEWGILMKPYRQPVAPLLFMTM